MASSIQNRLTNVAKRMITREGQAITLVRTLREEYNPATGESEKEEEILHTNGVGLTTVTGLDGSRIDGSRIDGSMVSTGQKTFLLTAEVEPKLDDILEIDGVAQGMIINPIEKVRPADKDIIYKVTVRI